MKTTRFAQESAAQAQIEAQRKRTRQDKAWDLAEQIYWAVEHGERLRAEQLLDTWADESKPVT